MAQANDGVASLGLTKNPFQFSQRETSRAIGYLNREVSRIRDSDYVDMVYRVAEACDRLWFNAGIEIWEKFKSEEQCSRTPRIQYELVDWHWVGQRAVELARMDYMLVDALSYQDLNELDEQTYLQEWGDR